MTTPVIYHMLASRSMGDNLSKSADELDKVGNCTCGCGCLVFVVLALATLLLIL